MELRRAKYLRQGDVNDNVEFFLGLCYLLFSRHGILRGEVLALRRQ